MAERKPTDALTLLAHAIAAPSLAAAFVLWFFVTWAPAAAGTRRGVVAALVVAGIGASLILSARGSRRVRTTGTTVMAIGLVSVVWNALR